MFSSGSSSLKVTQISKTDRAKFISIRTIDFETDRFDGDPRDAILWVEHFEDYFGTKGLAYLFDPLHPALLRPDHLYTLKHPEALTSDWGQSIGLKPIDWDPPPNR